MPRLFTVDEKWNRATTSKQRLAVFKLNPTEFLWRYVTVDKARLHHYPPELKVQSVQRVCPGVRAPNRARMIPSAEKFMVTICLFVDSLGIIFFERERAITEQYYGDLLDWFNAELKRKMVPFSEERSAILPTHSSAIASKTRTRNLAPMILSVLKHKNMASREAVHTE